MPEPIISINNISKEYNISHQASYGTLRDTLINLLKKPFNRHNTSKREIFRALSNISFDVQQGERVGIIGRNGAGKSTLLKILSQITPPTSGSVTLHGRVASLLEVGTGFHPELTGRENIFLNGAILGMKQSEIKKKFDEIVAFAEIEKFLDTPVKRYSSGMYVRLAFAVAAHLESEILIVDEVLAVGDAQFQQKCLRKMEDVTDREGRTVLFVSHNLPSVQAFCTRAVLLAQGKIQFIDTPRNIIQKYIGGTDMESKKQWSTEQCPRNGQARIYEIALRDQEGNIISHPTIDQSLQITIDYSIISDDASVGFTVNLYDENRTHVFSSINNHEPVWYGKSMPKGNYRSTCCIPDKFLNNGRYSVSIILFGKNFSDTHLINEAIGFTVLDAPEVRGDYFGEFAGTIRPLLQWKTQPITKEL
jgi:lipopolysaccharide transport system ATP-binding protein